jgi:hypothetical protein
VYPAKIFATSHLLLLVRRNAAAVVSGNDEKSTLGTIVQARHGCEKNIWMYECFYTAMHPRLNILTYECFYTAMHAWLEVKN